jgi:hypothetical protein
MRNLREKMLETKLSPPSPALDGYAWDSKTKSWLWAKDPSQHPLPEFTLPESNGLQAWLSGDWLKSQDAA